MPTILRAAGNGIRQELDASLTDVGLSATVDDGTPFSSSGGLIEIDYDDITKRERVYYLSKAGDVLTIADDGRGLFGTTAVAHDAGALVRVFFVDEHINNLVDLAETTEDQASSFVSILATGWNPIAYTCTYASAITFTISGDKTGELYPGMKFKLTQTTAKYFIITKVAYSAPNTTVTIYGGTDYTLANAAISSPYYSTQKSPAGFPMSPVKWTVSFADTTDRSQSTPSAGVWYNLGSASIAVPIGSWRLGYKCCLYTDRATATFSDSRSTLSTANNSESDASFSTYNAQSGASGTQQQYAHVQVELVKDVAAAATYYLNVGTPNSGIGAVGLKNIYETAQVYAVCAYL